MKRLFFCILVLCLCWMSGASIAADLSRVVTAAGNKSASVKIITVMDVNRNTTVPENVTLVFSRGGELRIAAGVTLTINAGIEAGSYRIFSGTGLIKGDVKVEAISPEWFYTGLYNNEKADWAPAINKAISLASTGCLKVKLQCKRYNVNSTVNLSCVPNNKADMVLEGAIRSTQYEKGTILIGNTGEGNCVVDTSDSDGISLKNIGIIRGKINPSSIGVLQARANGTGWSGDQSHENLYVNMGSNPSSNGGLGTIGVVNIAGEETRWHNLQVWANLPLVISWSSGCMRTKSDFSGQDSYSFTSPSGLKLATGASDTVFVLSGLGRLIAYDYISPCALINAAGSVDFGHTFMQMRASGTKGITPGNYQYAIESWNSYQFRHFGSIEGSGGYLLNRRDLTQADINVLVAGNGEKTLPAIYLYDDGGDYSISDSRINMTLRDVARPFIKSTRMDRNESEPMRFKISNTTFNTSAPYSTVTFPDKRILRNTTNSDWMFGNGVKLQAGDHTITTSVNKLIGTRGKSAELYRILMPTCISNQGGFTASVTMNGTLTNATGGGIGNPSCNTFQSTFALTNSHQNIDIKTSEVNTTNGTPATSLPAANIIDGVKITAIPDNTNNWVTVTAEPLTTGANNAEVTLNARITITWSGGLRDTVLIEL